MAIRTTYGTTPAMQATTLPGDYAVRPVTDGIWVIDPRQAPLQGAIMTGPPLTSRQWSWQLMTIALPTAVRIGIEGTDPPDTGAVERAFAYNGIFKDDELVATSLEARSLAQYGGIADEHEFQVALSFQKMVEQTDYNLKWQTFLAGSLGVGSQTDGLMQWIFNTGHARNVPDATIQMGNHTFDSTAYGAFLKDGGAGIPALTEAALLDGLQGSFALGNDIGKVILFVPPTLKRKISTFVQVYGVGSGSSQPMTRWNADLAEKMAGVVVDWYQSDFGIVGIVIDRTLVAGSTLNIIPTDSSSDFLLVGSQCIYGFDPDYIRRRDFHGYYRVELPGGMASKDGVAYSGGLEVLNPKSCIGWARYSS